VSGSLLQEIKTLVKKKTRVDWGFIEDREGNTTAGYVPTDKAGNVLGHSGVTIGSGVDLGSRTEQSLRDIGVKESTISTLLPYLGKKKEAALQYLDSNPVTLSDDDTTQLNKSVKQMELENVRRQFNKDSDTDLADLTPAQQTAITSLLFQYGSSKGIPTAWGHATQGRWGDFKKELENFGDKYPTRRKKEAGLL
jgi:hypothetical protein